MILDSYWTQGTLRGRLCGNTTDAENTRFYVETLVGSTITATTLGAEGKIEMLQA